MGNSISGEDKYFPKYLARVSICGQKILEVEDKALDSSLLSIFNRRNHAEFVVVLSQKIIELQSIASDIQRSTLSQSKADALNQLVQELIGLATALSTVCEGLHGKSLNMPYSYAQYMAEVNAVRAKKASCNLAQTRLFE